MFEAWHDFYILIGGASGALIGLLFVVATLSASMDSQQAERGIEVYSTPIIFHFCVILLMSALAMAPKLSLHLISATVAAAALGGLIYSLWVVALLYRPETVQRPHWSDLWYYGLAPATAYVDLGLVAVALWRHCLWAGHGLAAMILVLMFVGIRNAWDLVSWIAPRSHPA